MGAKTLLDTGGYEGPGGNGRTWCWTSGCRPGTTRTTTRPTCSIGAKGGPGGKPGCGSLPDVAAELARCGISSRTPVSAPGSTVRPNPGIGFPAWANYLPVTRAVPEPPSIRNLFGGPAIGPIPYPGAPAYGADLYAPDGTPLWPGLPPAPPPMAPREPGPTPGSEPFVVASPAQMQPTPLPRSPCRGRRRRPRDRHRERP